MSNLPDAKDAKTVSETKILIIDNDPDITMILKIFLETNGYSTWVANTAPAGFVLARQERPNLVLVDFELAGLNGLDFCQRVRSESLSDHLVVFLGFEADLQATQSPNWDCPDEFLAKPFTLKRFYSVIRKYV